ncbi:MAG: TetR/AcrR family transcriptional regulator, partial [Gammaproteobacteria bacterium]
MTGKREKTHQHLLESIHKSFRQHGYNGAGVDGLASAAGVTSGAFYSHFGSKAQAFREAVVAGVHQFDEAVEYYQGEYGHQWLEAFSKFYLREKRNCDLSESCALQSLSSEVARADEETKLAFQSELLKAAETFSAGMKSTNIQDAWPVIAMLVGGAILARAVKDQALAD